jgi:hypothetical protein
MGSRYPQPYRDLDNEAPLTHALWVIIITAVQGILLGFGMDWIMQRTGLELEERELRE